MTENTTMTLAEAQEALDQFERCLKGEFGTHACGHSDAAYRALKWAVAELKKEA